jgi:hypothetical protein
VGHGKLLEGKGRPEADKDTPIALSGW